ncbi:tetratricopeptide repeat protein [Sorangium cellulosum]|uniref:tetratricopeptide repeat protein n=1 Tax=Sorangium TaxID=39643 RepID=UPI000B336047|nr:tetratricopeptide repeat protein [Sorangium cellulosum]
MRKASEHGDSVGGARTVRGGSGGASRRTKPGAVAGSGGEVGLEDVPRKKRPSSAPRRRTPAAALTAEEMLRRALGAETPRSRALWARRGLSLRGPLDRTTQAMLLRQLYLAYFETRRFERASEVAEQIVALGVLSDVAHQDAARAKQARGDIEGAVGHLRLAARTGPASRRAFHWWTLGSVYHLARRYDDAIGALTRAARWGTRDKPLYQGHLAVVQCESGRMVEGLGALIDRLSEVPAGQGYGRFVLGQMAYFDRRWDEAKKYLEAFVQRSTSGRAAVAIALGGEIEAARRTLAAMAKR